MAHRIELLHGSQPGITRFSWIRNDEEPAFEMTKAVLLTYQVENWTCMSLACRLGAALTSQRRDDTATGRVCREVAVTAYT